MLPDITIIIITYNRPDEIRKTVTALAEHMHYDGRLCVLIADDCTPGKYAHDVCVWTDENTSAFYSKTLSASPDTNSGWGANANNALRYAADIVLQIEDDYVLTRDIDLNPLVALLLAHPGIGLIRLDGIAGHRAVAHAAECNISVQLPDYRQGMTNPGMLYYWLLDNMSRETWLYSNRPHLKHRRFWEFYGQYPEGLKLGATEESYAHQVKDLMTAPNAPAIAVPMDLAVPAFDHIGVSYQHTEFDK